MIRFQVVLLVGVSVLVSFLSFSSSTQLPPWNETWTDRLRQKLLMKYDKFARPSQHFNTTTVKTALSILNIEVIDMKSIFSVNGWLMMKWNDDKLKWNASDYGGLERVNLAVHEIWQPDIYLYNSASNGVEHYGDTHCIASQNGEVLWITPTIFHSYCSMDFTYWPFETNKCYLKLGSWAHNGDEIDIHLIKTGVDLDNYYSIGSWKIKDINASRLVQIYSCCPEPYVSIDFVFKITRTAELYYHIIFTPTVPIVFLSLITFWLQPHQEIKLVVNASIFLIVMLFLIYFGFKVPPRVDSMPVIVRFYSGCLYQITFSIIVSVVVINLSRRSYCSPIPRMVKNLLMGKLGKCLMLWDIICEIKSRKPIGAQELREEILGDIAPANMPSPSYESDRQSITPSSKDVTHLEWILLATAVDRLCFLLFCVVFAIMAIVYIHVDNEAFTHSAHTPH